MNITAGPIISNINGYLKESRLRLGLSKDGNLNVIAYKKSNINLSAVLESCSSIPETISFLNGLIWSHNDDMDEVARDIEDALDLSLLLNN